ELLAQERPGGSGPDAEVEAYAATSCDGAEAVVRRMREALDSAGATAGIVISAPGIMQGWHPRPGRGARLEQVAGRLAGVGAGGGGARGGGRGRPGGWGGGGAPGGGGGGLVGGGGAGSPPAALDPARAAPAALVGGSDRDDRLGLVRRPRVRAAGRGCPRAR